MHHYGGPHVLGWEGIELPPLVANEVRLRTLAAAVNRADCEIRSGKWPVQLPEPFPYVPGLEVVGEVIELGEAVSNWKPGDRAITMMQRLGGIHGVRAGGYQEIVTVAADVLAPLPATLDPLAVAALGLAGVTAWSGLQRLDLERGERLLVTGASGGVGSAAVRLGTLLGCTVIATSSGPRSAAYLNGLSPSRVVDLSRESLPNALGAQSLDAALDTLGARVFGDCVRCLAPGGRLCLVGALTGPDLTLSAWELMRDVRLSGWSSENLTGEELRAAMQTLTGWLADGSLEIAYRCFAMRDAAAAHCMMEQGMSGRALLVP